MRRELCQRQRTVSCAVQTSSVKGSLAVGVGRWTSRAKSWASSPSGPPTVFVPTVSLGTKRESYIPESICQAVLLGSAEPVESQFCHDEKRTVVAMESGSSLALLEVM